MFKNLYIEKILHILPIMMVVKVDQEITHIHQLPTTLVVEMEQREVQQPLHSQVL